MQHNGYLTELLVRGEKQKEILEGISPDEAEVELLSIHSRVRIGGEIDKEIRLKELDVKQSELDLYKKKYDLAMALLDKSPSLLTSDMLKSCF